jgi:hypothetical protein
MTCLPAADATVDSQDCDGDVLSRVQSFDDRLEEAGPYVMELLGVGAWSLRP